MKAFVGVIINMGILKLTDIKEQWSTTIPRTYHPFVVSSPGTDFYKFIGYYMLEI